MTTNVTFKVSAAKSDDRAAIHIDCGGLNYIAMGNLRHNLYASMIDCADPEHILKIDCFPRTDQGVGAVVDLLQNFKHPDKTDTVVTLQNASGDPLDIEALKASFTQIQQQGKGTNIPTPG